MSTTKPFPYSKQQLGALLTVTLIAGAIVFAHAAHADAEKTHNNMFDKDVSQHGADAQSVINSRIVKT